MEPKPSILVVDDEMPFLNLLRDYFSQRGIVVYCANTYPSAVNIMRRKKCPVVILDYLMPQIRGDDLIGKLQHIHPAARFIVVSGLVSGEIESKFKGLGYVAYFSKGSLSLRELEETIKKSLSL